MSEEQPNHGDVRWELEQTKEYLSILLAFMAEKRIFELPEFNAWTRKCLKTIEGRDPDQDIRRRNFLSDISEGARAALLLRQEKRLKDGHR